MTPIILASVAMLACWVWAAWMIIRIRRIK